MARAAVGPAAAARDLRCDRVLQGEGWELHWFGLKFKRRGSGLTKILLNTFFFFYFLFLSPPLTYCLLRGQNSIESTSEDGLVYGNIVFGYKQLCLEVNISELWDQTEPPT